MTDAPGGVSKSDYSFGQVAIRENLCTFEQVKECLDIQTKLRGLGIEPKKLGEILIEKGYVTPEQAVQIAKMQVQTASSQKVQIPGYEILSKIGAGAMGTVYKGRQVSMDRIVAIKILSGRYAKDTTFVDRFVREARAVAKLNHENIIGGIDVGEAGGLHYFVMEFVDGAPVHGMLKREGRIDEKRCLQIGLQMAKALAHAYKHGIIHRDVKPENIMITHAGVAKLCDLGLAKQTKGDADVTMDGTSVGTPNYISPEQARGEEKIDIRTDIYSLGASLYHMATGTTPFTGANPMVVMTKHVTDYPDPPKKRLASLSEGFSNLVMKMMQKRREDRHQDPDALIAEIETLLRGGEVSAAPAPRTPTSVVRPAVERPTRHPSTVRYDGLVGATSSSTGKLIGMGLAAVAAVVVAVLVLRGGGDPPPVLPNPGKTDSTAKGGGSTPAVSPTNESPDKLRKEVADFRKWAEGHFTNSTPDRFSAPYAQVLKKIELHKNDSNFEALTAWQEEKGNYVDKANKFITERVWEPIRAKADENLGTGRLSKAVEELAKFEDVFKYIGEGKQEKARATLQLEDRLQKIEEKADLMWLEGKQDAEKQFGDPATRDRAYGTLDGLAASLLPRQKKDVEDARKKFFESEVAGLAGTVPTPAGIKQAQDRVAKLRAAHAGNEAAVGELDGIATRLKEAAETFSKGALAQANSLYTTGFKPKFEEAMRARDLLNVRRHFMTIYYAKETAPLQTYLLPAPGVDAGLMKSFLDPMRIVPVEARKLAQMAEDAWKFSQRPGTSEAAKELYFDLRTAVLVEDLIEQSMEGARLAGRDPGKFKTGYSNQLKDASSADPLPRKAGEGVLVSVVQGGGKGMMTMALFPKKEPALVEDDVVALAKRAPSAANDPSFALKAFLFCHYGGKLSSAKAWYDKLTADQRMGLDRFTEGLKDVVSSAAESEARQLYEDGHALWKRKDEAGAVRKFKECLEKYGSTSYMKTPVKLTSGEKSRTQIIEELFKLSAPGGSSPGPKNAVKAKLTDVFNASEVRDLGKGKYDVTWTFKEDRELAAFQTVPGAFGGQIAATRGPAGGVRLAGSGLWSSVVGLKGDVLFELSFKMEQKKALGFVVHGKADQAGYAVLVDLEIPGAGQLDAVFKLPLQLGPQLLSSILAQGGKDLDLVKDMPSVARLERTGTKIKCSVNRGTIEADNALFNDGRVGLLVPDNSVIVDKIRIVGEVDKAWFDAAVKAAEAAAPPK